MPYFAGLLLCFIYLTELLLALSFDIEVNPGPRPPKFPCGSCAKQQGMVKTVLNVKAATMVLHRV